MRDDETVMGTDLLAPYGRNEPCWCGSKKKYKFCHGDKRPASLPGAVLPPDVEGSRYLSPSTSILISALTQSLPEGTGFYLPPSGPAPTSISYTNWEEDLSAAMTGGQDALSLNSLGGLRIEVLRRLAGLPRTDGEPSDDILTAIYRLAGETVRAVAQLAKQQPRRTILWNQELEVASFLGRTLLLADHVLYPDEVFQAVLNRATNAGLRHAAERQLTNEHLLASGIAIPVPPGAALAARGELALDLTASDLKRDALVAWVRSQIILEGPTAREVLFARAADDLKDEVANFWLYGRIDRESLDDENRTFRTAMLQPYDPEFDYQPWISQVTDSAVGALVQRTNERVVTADLFGSEYVSASMFEARLLRAREREARIGPAQAAVWADIPELPDLTSPDLARLLHNEHAVEDLRQQVRASLATARTDIDSVDAITELSHGLAAAAHKLERTAGTDLAWQGVAAGGFASASMIVGGIAGGLLGVGAGALGSLAAVAPYLGSRLNTHRDAAYLFVAGRRARR